MACSLLGWSIGRVGVTWCHCCVVQLVVGHVVKCSVVGCCDVIKNRNEQEFRVASKSLDPCLDPCPGLLMDGWTAPIWAAYPGDLQLTAMDCTAPFLVR
jgi:hypothetical protein